MVIQIDGAGLYNNIMNNFINFSKKLQRNSLERGIISAVNKNTPNVEQYIGTNRYPVMPKIVVYSAAVNANSLFERIFPFYKVVTPALSAESDEVITQRIADQLTQVPEDVQPSSYGYLVKGFPFNTSQALMLDRYLNGVNLAIYLKTANQSSDYVSSIQSLLGYYSERGTLLELEIEESREPTFEEAYTALEEIRIKIKRSH